VDHHECSIVPLDGLRHDFRTRGAIEESHAVGFGKAKPGNDHPTLYLSGKVAFVVGFSHSDDRSGDIRFGLADELYGFYRS
jgi:hypothetical protein